MQQSLHKLFIALALLGALSSHAVAAPDTPVRVASTADVTATLRAMLADYRRYAEKQWHTDTADPGMGYWGSGHGDGTNNEGVRAVSTTALVYALLGARGDTAFKTTDRVGPALRYAAAIHVTGTRAGTNGARWGDSWQSAMWAANLGTAAWLARGTLDSDTLAAVKRVIGHEADRFNGQVPPTMAPGDTKAEENAWNLTAPAVALLLMPDDARAAGWHAAVLRYGFNTISVDADKTLKTPADGRAVGDWVTTTQLHPDYTLENHNIFHPVYAMIAPATNAQAAVDYRLGGRPVPDALTFNVLQEWAMLQYIALPDGEWLYPQGLDWDLHDYEHLHYWTMLATLYHDPAAALLERRTVAYARRRQILNGDGSFVGPSGSLGFAREAVQSERVAFALLMHEQFGAPPPASQADYDRMAAHLAPARAFPWVGMAVHRTARGLVSFSWKNHLMAQVVPQSAAHLDQPYVTTPNLETLVGGFSLQGQSGREARVFHVNRQAVGTSADGFVAGVDADINAGQLRQQVAVASVAPGVVAYIDRVTAQKAVTVTEERGLLLGIENDEVSGNVRHIETGDGSHDVPGGQGRDTAITGRWADIDGRLGLVSALGGPLLYRAAGPPNRAGAREDFLMGSYRAAPRPFAAGEVVSERAGLVLPDATAAETARVAAGLVAARTPDGLSLRFTAPDGRHHTLLLTPAGTARWDGQEVKETPTPPARRGSPPPPAGEEDRQSVVRLKEAAALADTSSPELGGGEPRRAGGVSSTSVGIDLGPQGQGAVEAHGDRVTALEGHVPGGVLLRGVRRVTAQRADGRAFEGVPDLARPQQAQQRAAARAVLDVVGLVAAGRLAGQVRRAFVGDERGAVVIRAAVEPDVNRPRHLRGRRADGPDAAHERHAGRQAVAVVPRHLDADPLADARRRGINGLRQRHLDGRADGEPVRGLVAIILSVGGPRQKRRAEGGDAEDRFCSRSSHRASLRYG